MNLKGAGIVPFFAIFLLFSLAPGLKLEVEVITPITKARSFPSASSDPKGFVRKGQTYIVDGQSGEWYRISVYNSFVWIPKDAVKVLRSEEEPSATAAAPAAADSKQPSSARQPGKAAAEPSSAALAAALLRAGQTAPAVKPPSQTGEAALAAQKIAPAETTITEEKSPSAVKKTQQKADHAVPHAVAAVKAPPPPPPPPPPPRSRTWFSKRSAAAHIPLDADGKEVLYFQVSNKTVPVHAARGGGSAVLTRVKKGDYFPVLQYDSLWCKVAVNDIAGWVVLAGGAIVNAPESGILDEYIVILIIAAGAVAALLLLAFIFFLRGRVKKKPPETARFHGLIIARAPPAVQGVLSGKPVQLEKFLTSIGFSITAAPDLGKAQTVIDRQRLDVVFIDWYISEDIPGTVEILFAAIEQKNLPLAIFYNVPNTTDPPLIPVLLRAYHLGPSFSDHDIYNLLTPTMLSTTDRKSTAASALEGDIADGNLPEIMEFIEIGKKTGALTIEAESPIGVLYFTEGRVVHAAAANGVSGRDAINTLLNLKQGRFRFLLDKQPKVKNLNLSTLEVLMEWTKTEDEAHRD